jgi:hypothetical protein
MMYHGIQLSNTNPLFIAMIDNIGAIKIVIKTQALSAGLLQELDPRGTSDPGSLKHK